MGNNKRANQQITESVIVLIDEQGINKGKISKFFALNQARERGLDLVEVGQIDKIPICKILDFKKVLYEQKKNHKKQHGPNLKEISFKYHIGDHDLEIKKRKIEELLKKGHRVSFSMILKGRDKSVNLNAARTKFEELSLHFNPTLKKSDIKESEKGFSIILSPQ